MSFLKVKLSIDHPKKYHDQKQTRVDHGRGANEEGVDERPCPLGIGIHLDVAGWREERGREVRLIELAVEGSAAAGSWSRGPEGVKEKMHRRVWLECHGTAVLLMVV